ncbi:MAG TPA: DUF4230 domain-containing protein [Cryptosporangiaceae bacterium]|nr:DUF4230 domain-containing protein [Cryptosporangiaceae bacterium]
MTRSDAGDTIPLDTVPDSTPPAHELVVRVDRRRGLLGALVVVVLLIAVVLLGLRSFGIGDLPFGQRTVDRSQPVVLESVQDLSRFEAASGNFQVIVDLEKDTKYVPSAIFGERTLFVAAGTVDAYVDFAGLSGDALEVSADRSTVEVTVPRPALEKPNLDPDNSYVFAQDRGIVNRFQSLFGDDPNRLQEIYKVAEQKLAEAATRTDLAARAEQNTRAMLQSLLKSLGFTTVTVTFTGP